MTMTFIVKDKKLPDKLAVDKKVDFEFVQQGSGNISEPNASYMAQRHTTGAGKPVPLDGKY